MNRVLIISIISIILASTMLSCKQKDSAGIVTSSWGSVEGKEVFLFYLSNENGMQVHITNYGATITSMMVPDRDGELGDVVLGFDNLEQYTSEHPCFGATIGRVANRIKNGRFTIDSIEYLLTQNDGKQCLHGGREFDRAVWDAETIKTEEGYPGIKMHYFSPEGSHGFPGNMNAYVTYYLTDEDAIHVHFEATTDRTTHVDMTQHSYFNLTACAGDILDHIVKIDADKYLEIDEDVVPTGGKVDVVGTEKDLTKPVSLRENIFKLDLGGYHFHYVFNKAPGKLEKVVEIIEPRSGRTLDVFTTQPGIQFYTGNAISDELQGKGVKYGPHMGFCLETHYHPNTPNCMEFPSTLLYPGETYDELVIYDFGVAKH